MAEYKVEVDLSDLFDDMTINEQKNFLVEKFSSLPIYSKRIIIHRIHNLNLR